MSLPALPGGNKNEKFNNKSSPGVGVKLPKISLPELENLELNNVAEIGKNKSSQGLPSEQEKIKENIEIKDIRKDNFENLKDIEDNSANIEESEDNSANLEESEDNFLEESEEDWDPGEGYSFLPTVDFEDVEEDSEDNSEKGFEDNLLPEVNTGKKSNKKAKPNKKDFKEFDDEAVKQFFIDLKNKLFGEQNKNKKPQKTKKSQKTNKTKNNNKPKSKKIKKDNKPFNLKILIYIAISIITIGFILFLFNAIILSYKPLNELSKEIKEENNNIYLENFAYKDKNTIKFKAKNLKDISTDFVIDAVVKAKNPNSLKKEKFICQSDIIALESLGEVEEILKCENFEKDLKYKIDIELIEIK